MKTRTFDISIVVSNFLVHRVTAALQARGKGAVIGADRLSLLLLVITTFLLLTPILIPPSESTKERSGRRTDCCAFARIAGDCATDGTNRRTTRRAAQHSALGSFLRRRSTGHIRVRGIDAGPLNRPGMAFIAIPILLLRALSLTRVNIHLLRYRWLADQSPKERGRHQPGRSSQRHSKPSFFCHASPARIAGVGLLIVRYPKITIS
jgi:hypothetical protein